VGISAYRIDFKRNRYGIPATVNYWYDPNRFYRVGKLPRWRKVICWLKNGLQVGQNIGDAVPEVGNAMKISIPL
jgi:ribosomal protein L2